MNRPEEFSPFGLPRAPEVPPHLANITLPTQPEVEAVAAYVAFYRGVRPLFPQFIPADRLANWEAYLSFVTISRNFGPALSAMLAPLTEQIRVLAETMNRSLAFNTNQHRVGFNASNNMLPNKPLVMLVSPENSEVAPELTVADLASLNSMSDAKVEELLTFYHIQFPAPPAGAIATPAAPDSPTLTDKQARLHRYLLTGAI